MPGRGNPEDDEAGFRTFTGTPVWDYDALQDAYAHIRQRSPVSQTTNAVEAEPVDATGTPEGLCEAGRPPGIDGGGGPGARAPSPSAGRVLSAVGAAAATAAVLAGAGWLLVHALGSNAAGSAHADTATTGFVYQTSAAGTTVDAQSPDITGDADSSPSPTDPLPSPSPSPSPSPQSDPQAVVDAFYDAIDSGDYQLAWNLGGDNLSPSYAAFVAGYAGTESVEVSAVDLDATTASVDIYAAQDDGTVRQYSGTYTVVDGVITGADVKRTD